MREVTRLVRTGLVLALFALSATSIAGAASQATKGGGPDQGKIQKLKDNARGSVRISIKNATNRAGFIQAGQNGDLNPSGPAGSAAAKATDFLDEYGSVLGVDPTSTLVATKNTTDSLGATHITYEQVYNGVPVFGGTLKAHLDRENNLTAVNGTAVPDITVDTQPKLSEADAGARAIAAVLADPPTNDATGQPAQLKASDLSTSATLYVYRTGLVRGVTGSSQLVYQVEVTNGAGVREFVFVSAHVGKIVNRFSAASDALYRRVFEKSFTAAAQVWEEGQSLAALTQDQANIVEFTGEAYQHYLNAFGRDSYDGLGHVMNIVNNDPRINCPNANWNGITTNYCNGVTSDDVVAHEWSHAYTEYTHGLIYQWQPGALNESYSDIWGETIDQINGLQTDTPGGTRGVSSCSTHTAPIPILVINAPTPGSCAAGAASFGAPLTGVGVTGDLVLANDGVADPSTSNGCTALLNPASVAGKVVLVDRGVCGFTVKVKNAQNAGAIAVVVANNNGGPTLGLGGGDATIVIPALGISNANGDLLKTYLVAGLTNVTLKVKGGSNPPQDNVKWLMGEDSGAFNPTAGDGNHAIRDMWEPTCLSDPGKVTDAEYQCDTSDAGGVHTNSGVPNHGYALLVDGGMYNAHAVVGIGLTKAAAIYWRAESVYQTKTTDFADHADALEASCADLVGKPINNLSTGASAGVSSQVISAIDCAQVTSMIAAVELRTEPTQCAFTPLFNQSAPALCPNSTPQVLYSEDFQNGSSGSVPVLGGIDGSLKKWTLTNQKAFAAGSFATDWAATSTLPGGRSGSAAYAADLDGQCSGGAGDQSGVMRMESEPIKLNGKSLNPQLSFDHYLASERDFDGGNVKISVNGGAYVLIPKTAYTFNGPNTTLATAAAGNTNPLAGQEAFSGTDGGQVTGTWSQSQVDLSKVGVKPGDTIRLRFDFGMDGCGAIDGWYVDDVKVTACKPNETIAASNETARKD